MAKRKTLDYFKVAFCETWPQFYSKTCSLEKEPFKSETTGTVCSWGVGQNTCIEGRRQKSHLQLQESFDCSDCLKRLCNKIWSCGYHHFCPGLWKHGWKAMSIYYYFGQLKEILCDNTKKLVARWETLSQSVKIFGTFQNKLLISRKALLFSRLQNQQQQEEAC